MEKDEAYKILLSYNSWRRGSEIPMPSPYIIGQAIEVALNELKWYYNLQNKTSKSEVVNILISNALRLPDEYREMVIDKLRGITTVEEKNERVFEIETKMKYTDCCGMGPITNEKFCPECGKKIIKTS